MAEVTRRPGQVLNLHFFNPDARHGARRGRGPRGCPRSDRRAIHGFCRRIGKVPVLMRKEVPGFIVNRIYRALTREAVSLLEGGYASAEDIDLAW